MSASASDIMVKRYGVQDVERYKEDHQYIVAGILYSGVALGAFATAGAIVLTSDIESVTPSLLCVGAISLMLSFISLQRVRRGARA